MNKIAVLILAHKAFQQLGLFINQFRADLFDIYIHVDRKATIPETFVTFLKQKDNVFLLDDMHRLITNWGGISLVRAEICLLKTAQSKPHSFYLLCSGQDLLIQPSENLYIFLSKHQNENFNSLVPSIGKLLKRVEIKYADFMFSKTLPSKLSRNIYQILTGGRRNTFSLFKRKFASQHSFLFGSQWFCYNHMTVQYILSYLSDHPEYEEEYKSCLVPDESFFQTIIGESDLLSRTVHKGLTYYRFLPGKASPETLKVNDYQSLLNSSLFIARKFDIEQDYEIIKIIINKTSANLENKTWEV